jgi:pimeloyl-ACP methyl ester carboxylesterase
MSTAVATPLLERDTGAEQLRRVEVDGAALACGEAGPASAEPVVLLHGYPSNHRIWRHQVRHLSQHHRVLAPDLLGWGESDRPLGLSFDYETEVSRLGRVLDALGVERCNLFGHDYGGFLALGFCQRNPERVGRLALLNSRAQGTFVPRWYATFGLASLAGRVPGLRELATRLPMGAVHRRSLRPLLRSGAIDAELLESYVAWMDEPEGRRWLLHFFSEYRVGTRRELRRRLPEIGCPTAVVWGRRDEYLSSKIALELARAIPDCELTMLDDAGHFVMEERPQAVSAALEALLQR